MLIRTGAVHSLKNGQFICHTYQRIPSNKQVFDWGFSEGQKHARSGQPFKPSNQQHFFRRGYMSGYAESEALCSE